MVERAARARQPRVHADESRWVAASAGRGKALGRRYRTAETVRPPHSRYASGGTFIKHPLTLAAARAVLQHLDERGPSLQSDLNARTAVAVAAITT